MSDREDLVEIDAERYIYRLVKLYKYSRFVDMVPKFPSVQLKLKFEAKDAELEGNIKSVQKYKMKNGLNYLT